MNQADVSPSEEGVWFIYGGEKPGREQYSPSEKDAAREAFVTGHGGADAERDFDLWWNGGMDAVRGDIGMGPADLIIG